MVFVRAVELGSFSAAAQALQISPQLVGKQVGQLEAHLGVQLLHRTTRRQSPTDFGHVFYDRAKIMLADVEAAESLAAEALATPTGRLRINAPVSFGMHALAPRLPGFLRDHPQVTVDLTLNNRAIDLVDEGYDATFRVGELADSRLVGRALAPRDLQQHECLGFASA